MLIWAAMLCPRFVSLSFKHNCEALLQVLHAHVECRPGTLSTDLPSAPAGEALELAVILSLKMQDDAAFERNFLQLRTYYTDTRWAKLPSVCSCWASLKQGWQMMHQAAVMGCLGQKLRHAGCLCCRVCMSGHMHTNRDACRSALPVADGCHAASDQQLHTAVRAGVSSQQGDAVHVMLIGLQSTHCLMDAVLPGLHTQNCLAGRPGSV